MKLLNPITVAAFAHLTGVVSALEKIHFNDLYYFRGTDHPDPIQLNECIKIEDGLGSDCTPEESSQDLGHNPEVKPAIESYKCE
ncbi:hypothetical protein FQN54_005735 [Arachnomyces sp. PD_36]|nr:hypothetical protein FQN54_005735 [Arachnomyces sp. PD_36]